MGRREGEEREITYWDAERANLYTYTPLIEGKGMSFYKRASKLNYEKL